MVEYKKYLIEINNYGEGKPKKVEVQSERDLVAMFGLTQSRDLSSFDNIKVQEFWDEIDLVCPEYDCNNDEISMIHGPY
jgi:hypothetical protein